MSTIRERREDYIAKEAKEFEKIRKGVIRAISTIQPEDYLNIEYWTDKLVKHGTYETSDVDYNTGRNHPSSLALTEITLDIRDMNDSDDRVKRFDFINKICLEHDIGMVCRDDDGKVRGVRPTLAYTLSEIRNCLLAKDIGMKLQEERPTRWWVELYVLDHSASDPGPSKPNPIIGFFKNLF